MQSSLGKLLTLFIPTFLFLTIFSGFYIYLDIYFLPGHEYESYTFTDGKQRSDLEILALGFSSPIGMLDNLVVASIFALLGRSYLESTPNRSKLNVVLNGIVLTFFLGGLYLIYYLFSIGFTLDISTYSFKYIKPVIFTLLTSYFIIAIVVSYLYVPRKLTGVVT